MQKLLEKLRKDPECKQRQRSVERPLPLFVQRRIFLEAAVGFFVNSAVLTPRLPSDTRSCLWHSHSDSGSSRSLLVEEITPGRYFRAYQYADGKQLGINTAKLTDEEWWVLTKTLENSAPVRRVKKRKQEMFKSALVS